MIKQHVKNWIQAHRLLSALILVIGITGILTSISMTMYITSGASGLDLSRPGFDADRKKVENTKELTFSPTGPLSEADFKAFMKSYTEQRKKLNSMGAFDSKVLSDESLGLTPVTESNPDN